MRRRSKIDRDVREISIRDLRVVPALATPQILRARNAREFRSIDDEAAVPVAAREFQPDRAPADPLSGLWDAKTRGRQ